MHSKPPAPRRANLQNVKGDAHMNEVIGALIIGGLVVGIPLLVVGVIGAIAGCMRSSQISQERGEE